MPHLDGSPGEPLTIYNKLLRDPASRVTVAFSASRSNIVFEYAWGVFKGTEVVNVYDGPRNHDHYLE